MEKQIKIAARLYEIRDTVKEFWKDEYAEKIRRPKLIIQMKMQQDKLDVIPALMNIIEVAGDDMGEMSKIIFIAAATELMVEA